LNRMLFTEKVAIINFIKGESVVAGVIWRNRHELTVHKNRSIGTSAQRVRLPASPISKGLSEVRSIMRKRVNQNRNVVCKIVRQKSFEYAGNMYR